MPEVTVTALGLSLSPSPRLLLHYSEAPAGRARRREMPLRDLGPDSDGRVVAERLRRRHAKHLGPVAAVRVERLVLAARETLRGRSLAEGLRRAEAQLAGDPGEDLNTLSDSELKRRKDIMEIQFDKNSIGPGHPDYVYDRETDFGGVKEAVAWDEESEVEGEKVPGGEGPAFSAPEQEEEEDFW